MKKEILKKQINLKSYLYFPDAGGLDLGFVQAGFETVWANDNDHWSCETYKRNFGNHIIEGDIADIDFKNTPACDLITGGFPCQDFSMIWKRGGLTTDRGNYTSILCAPSLKKSLKRLLPKT